LLIKSFRKNIEKKLIKYLFIYFSVVFILLGFVSALSYSKYGDNRYISGTYGSIGLYCAFNPYIKLEKNYYSQIWKTVQPELQSEAIEPLKLRSTWKDRDKLLKLRAVSFIINNPLKAIKGYLWRTGKYTWMSSDAKQLLLFYLSLISILLGFRYKKQLKTRYLYCFHLFLSIYLILYYVGIKSLFVYVGKRHHIDTVPILFQPIAVLLIILADLQSIKIPNESLNN
jgi:hypothetical protein